MRLFGLRFATKTLTRKLECVGLVLNMARIKRKTWGAGRSLVPHTIRPGAAAAAGCSTSLALISIAWVDSTWAISTPVGSEFHLRRNAHFFAAEAAVIINAAMMSDIRAISARI
jgi:hypothetical protein